MAELQTILSSGQITEYYQGDTTSGDKLLTSDEINTAQKSLAKITTVNEATYDLLVTDYLLHVTYTDTGTVAITLPTLQTTENRALIIKDAGGGATTYNITIQTEGSETIDGESTLVIDSNYSSVSIYSDGSNWFMY